MAPRRFLVTILLPILIIPAAAPAFASGLSVGSEGVILKDGRPYRAIGVNYVDAFWRHLDNHADFSFEQGFADLGRHGIPFARFGACGFWPSQFKLYVDDRETYLALLDDIVQAAEEAGVGLIPSLFWAYFAVPDLVGESVNQWGNPNSATIAFMRQYTQDIVSRYKDSPAIWAWEFGNEYFLCADLGHLSGASELLPPVIPELGTPAFRTAADHFTTATLLYAYREFAAAVRAVDPNRPVTAGDGFPRSYAEDLRAGREWSEIDTVAEFQENIRMANPEGIDLASVHLYPDDARFAPGYVPTYGEVLALTKEAAAQNGAALFVGEFGASTLSHGGLTAAVQTNLAMIDALLENRVPLAALWVYDYAYDSDNWTVTFSNNRSPILAAIAQANVTIHADTDGDRILDLYEDANGNGVRDGNETDPFLLDTDNDGVDDNDEIAFGHDPLDPQDAVPVPLPWLLTAPSLLAAALRALRPHRR